MTGPRQPRACAVCGAPAPFGFGPPLRRDRVWTCAAHKSAGAPKRDIHGSARAPSPAPKDDRAPDLFSGR